MVNEIQCSNSNKGGALFTRVLCQKSKLWRWLHMATTLSSLQHSSVLDPSPIHYVRATLPAKSTSCSITSLTYKLATYPDTQRSDWKRINYRITYNLQLTVIMKYFCQTLTDVLETTDTNSTVQAVVKVPLDAAEQEHQGNSVPAPPIIEIQRSHISSNFTKTLRGPQPPAGAQSWHTVPQL